MGRSARGVFLPGSVTWAKGIWFTAGRWIPSSLWVPSAWDILILWKGKRPRGSLPGAGLRSVHPQLPDPTRNSPFLCLSMPGPGFEALPGVCVPLEQEGLRLGTLLVVELRLHPGNLGGDRISRDVQAPAASRAGREGAGRQNLPAGTSQPLPGWRIRLEPRILQAGQSSRPGKASLKLLEQAVPPLAAAVARMSGGCSRAGLEPPVFSDEILPPQTCQEIKGIAPVPGLHTQHSQRRSGPAPPLRELKAGAALPPPGPARPPPAQPSQAQPSPARLSSPESAGSERIQRFFPARAQIPAPGATAGMDSLAPRPRDEVLPHGQIEALIPFQARDLGLF